MKYLSYIILIIVLTCDQTSFVDSRDGKTYSVLTIKDQDWLKENLRFSAQQQITEDDQFGGYYGYEVLDDICPDGYHVPTLQEWQTFIANIPGKNNSRQGRLVPTHSLTEYRMLLGGKRTDVGVAARGVMGFYWTSTDTLKTYYKQPDYGLQRHLIGIHIWSSGEKDSINVEPTYMLAKKYESLIKMNCKCVKTNG